MNKIDKPGISITRERCEYSALFMLMVCAFVIPISVTATTVSYLLAWLLVMASGDWRCRWQRIRCNVAAISFWILFCLFLFGLSYTSSTSSLAFADLHKRHWLLMTPFFIMIIIDDRWRQNIINAFLSAMVLTLVLALLKQMGVDLIGDMLKTHQPESNVFLDHIVQNFFMSIAAFVFAYRALLYRKWRYINLVIFLLMAYCIFFLSASRTGYAIFLLLLSYLTLLTFGYKGIIIAALTGALLLVVAYLNAPMFRDSVRNIPKQYAAYQQGDTMTSVGQRVGMLANAWILIKQRPWLGQGTGGVRTAMQQSLSQQTIDRTGLFDYVEYSAINFLLQFGIVGLGVFLMMIGLQIYASFKIRGEYRHLMQGFLLAFLAGSFFNSFFVSFCETHLYSIFSAICFSAIPGGKKNDA